MLSIKQNSPLFFLIDCNQFFVSCELLFQPQLQGKPVIVLSSNDGCVISRSKEAKVLGIPMGIPAFKVRDIIRSHRVHLFSSNFSLYGDLSHRVMQVLYHFAPDVEEYSVDEAFLFLRTPHPHDFAFRIREKILRWTGIPVSIGVGFTKTLAKLASDLAKVEPTGVLVLEQQTEQLLAHVDVQSVWGIGKALSDGLKAQGIPTALALRQADPHWIAKRFSSTLMQTVLELQGTPCFSIEHCPPCRKSLTYSRSLSKPTENLQVIEELLASYTARVAATLRNEGLLASFLSVFLMTSPFLPRPYSNSATISLDEPSQYSPTLIAKAKQVLAMIFRSGYLYKKVGIILGGFVVKERYQLDLFHSDRHMRKKRTKAMQALDHIQSRFGANSLRFAAEASIQKEQTRSDHRSPCFTTAWEELLTVHL